MLVDIRSEAQRGRDGLIPGALFIPRNVLEWRCDAASPFHHPGVAQARRRVIVMCDEGYQSSLAAATLQELGLEATDIIGGFQAWRSAGLPVRPREGGTMRAIECPYGHRVEAADDEELFRNVRDHVDRHHPELERTDEQLRERIAADAHDVREVGE